MYINLRQQVNEHFNREREKYSAILNGITNEQVLESWYYRDRLTENAYQEVKAGDPSEPISETVKKKMLARFNRDNEKDRARYIEKLARAEQANAPVTVTIIVTWNNNRTWGKNPTAEVIAKNTRTTATASGCGYDKESASISSAFNKNHEIMRILYDHAERNGEFAYSVYKTAGVPWFDGGCGVSCFYSVFEKCGYTFKEVAHSKITDVYQIIRKEAEQ